MSWPLTVGAPRGVTVRRQGDPATRWSAAARLPDPARPQHDREPRLAAGGPRRPRAPPPRAKAGRRQAAGVGVAAAACRGWPWMGHASTVPRRPPRAKAAGPRAARLAIADATLSGSRALLAGPPAPAARTPAGRGTEPRGRACWATRHGRPRPCHRQVPSPPGGAYPGQSAGESPSLFLDN